MRRFNNKNRKSYPGDDLERSQHDAFQKSGLDVTFSTLMKWMHRSDEVSHLARLDETRYISAYLLTSHSHWHSHCFLSRPSRKREQTQSLSRPCKVLKGRSNRPSPAPCQFVAWPRKRRRYLMLVGTRKTRRSLPPRSPPTS